MGGPDMNLADGTKKASRGPGFLTVISGSWRVRRLVFSGNGDAAGVI